MRSTPITKRSHHTESLERPKKAPRLAKGTPLSLRIALGRPYSLKTRSKMAKAYCSFVLCRASQHSR
jgi:hypothetical protein